MNGLSVTILVTAFCVLIVGLFAVIVDRTNERDEARAELDHRDDVSDELVSVVAMAESLALELSHADATIRNLAAKVAKWERVNHFRRGHCYWLVIRNGGRCERAATRVLPPGEGRA